jgi:phosphatidylglycerol lysyltransferase
MDAAAKEPAAAHAVALPAPDGSAPTIDVPASLLPELAYRYGHVYDSYLATEPGRTEFWSRDRYAALTYIRRGRHLLVGGGLLAAADRKEQLLREFVEFASDLRRRVVFHNICDHDLPLFRQFGFQVTKWGEEPIVDLTSCTWGGKAYEWVRRQTNYCQRQGLEAFEVSPEALTGYQWSRTIAEALEVSAESLATKPQAREMKYYEGQIATHPLGLRRLFIARSDHGTGRMEGFVVCNPMHNGTMWAAEIYRHRLDCVRGTVAFLLQHIARQLQTEGVQGLSLCLVPGQRCGTPMAGDSFLLRHGLQVLEHGFGWAYDIAGMRHFKTRFRPRYEPRYVCALPNLSIGSLYTMLSAFDGLRFDYVKVVRTIADRFRKRSARAHLAHV